MPASDNSGLCWSWCDQAEQQLCIGLVEWREAHFINEHHVIAQQVVDDTADGVIGETAIELLDEVRCPAVAFAQALLNCAVSDANQYVALTGA